MGYETLGIIRVERERERERESLEGAERERGGGEKLSPDDECLDTTYRKVTPHKAFSEAPNKDTHLGIPI